MYFLIKISHSHPICHSTFEYVVAAADIDDVDDHHHHHLKSKVTRLSNILSNRDVHFLSHIKT